MTIGHTFASRTSIQGDKENMQELKDGCGPLGGGATRAVDGPQSMQPNQDRGVNGVGGSNLRLSEKAKVKGWIEVK